MVAVTRPRVPVRGDIVWLNFAPTKGTEQAGHRPALILSHEIFNRASKRALVCPITSKAKGHPLEVKIPSFGKFKGGVVLSDQVRSVSWKERGVKRIDTAPPRTCTEVIEKINTLIN